jgi:hypothetical protein
MPITRVGRQFVHTVKATSGFFDLLFSQREDRTGSILLMLVFLIDAASYQILQVITISSESIYARIWKDTLTNRLFEEKLFDKIRDREHVDVDSLFKEASTRSTEDIKVFLKDTTVWVPWSLNIGQIHAPAPPG